MGNIFLKTGVYHLKSMFTYVHLVKCTFKKPSKLISGVLTDVAGYDGLLYGEQKDAVTGKVLKSEEDQNSESQIVAQNFERIHTDFLVKLKNAQGDLGKIEDQYLGQLAMVLGVTCLHDPKDYFGHNLIDELYNRAVAMIDKPDFKVNLLVVTIF